MNGWKPKEKNREDQKDDGTAGRVPHAPRRVSSFPLPLAPGAITDTQAILVCEVIALAEAADLAEAARARRRPRSEVNACWMPEFGSDMSNHLPTPETRKLKAFIDEQRFEDRTLFIKVMFAGQHDIRLTASSIASLLSDARGSADHAGDYMSSKSHLAHYLKEGLKKFESFTRGTSRRWR
ncbi:MAG: hypothetical protein K8S94_09175 [Planctomycetia bacterium]|nr:hypothetical protein [Planctomycetia bacterium]